MDYSKYSPMAKSILEEIELADFIDNMLNGVPKYKAIVNTPINDLENASDYLSSYLKKTRETYNPILNEVINKDENKLDKEYFLFPTDNDSRTVYVKQYNALKNSLVASSCLSVEEQICSVASDTYNAYPTFESFKQYFTEKYNNVRNILYSYLDSHLIEETGVNFENGIEQEAKERLKVAKKTKSAKTKRGFATFLWAVMIFNLVSGFIPMLTYNASFEEMLMLYFGSEITILYIAIFIICSILISKYKKVPKKLDKQVQSIKAECLDFYSSYMDEKVSPALNKMYEECFRSKEEYLKKKHSEFVENYKEIKEIYANDRANYQLFANKYLPSRVVSSDKVLSLIVEYMENGRAVTYKDALFLAEQKIDYDLREESADKRHQESMGQLKQAQMEIEKSQRLHEQVIRQQEELSRMQVEITNQQNKMQEEYNRQLSDLVSATERSASAAESAAYDLERIKRGETY